MVEQKIYFTLDKRVSKKGKSIIQVRLNQGTSKQVRSTGFKVTVSLWNQEEQAITNRRQRTQFLEEERLRVGELFGNYQAKILENQDLLVESTLPFNLDDVINYGTSSKNQSVQSAKVIDWINYIHDYKHTPKSVIKGCKTLKHHLEAWMPQLRWHQVNESLVLDLVDYLIDRGLNRNSVNKFMQHFKYVAHKSKLVDLSEIKISTKLKTARPSEPKEPLNFVELKSIFDCTVRPEVEPYRQMFLFQCTTGLRFSDCNGKQFKSSVYGIKFNHEKTGTHSFAPITELNRPVFEYFGEKLINGGWSLTLPKISNQKYNAHMKTLMTAAGIEKNISSHIGRHTYARLLSDLNVPEEIRAKLLGHARSTTGRYGAGQTDEVFLSRITNAVITRALSVNAENYHDWLMALNPIAALIPQTQKASR